MRTKTVIRRRLVPGALLDSTLDGDLRAVAFVRQVSMIMTLILLLYAQSVH